MKKEGIISLVILMALSSCSHNEAVEPEADAPAIAFSADMSEKNAVVRSGGLEETGVNSFRVWSYKSIAKDGDNYTDYQTVMNGYYVRWTDDRTQTNSDDWEYILLAYPSQKIKFWDFSAKAYRFFAIAPETACGEGDITRGADRYDFTLYADATNPETTPYFSRLWFSDKTTKPFGQPVTMEFVQPLAYVRFLYAYSDPDADPLPMLEDPDLRPFASGQRIAVTGDVTISYPLTGAATTESWTSEVDWSKYLFSFTTPYETSADWETVLPIRDQGPYKFTVTVNGEDRWCTVPAQFMDWAPGYQYTYVFKVNDEGGVELDNVRIGIPSPEWEPGKVSDNYNLFNW